MVVVMAGKKTFHSAQGTKLHNVRSDDIIVLAQTDATALEGYRTISAPMSDAAKGVTNQIKAEGGAGIIVSDPTEGITGDGKAETPLAVDTDYFNKNWVTNQFVHVTQVGNQSQQILPIVKGTGYNLTFSNDITVYLGGLNLTYAARTVDIRSQVSAPDGKTLYMYFTLVDNELRLLITGTPRAERYDSTYIGTLVVGSGSISSVDARPFMRLGNYRLSETAQGSAIPVSSNSPWVAEYPTWGGQGTLSPINAGIDTTRYTNKPIFDLVASTTTITYGCEFFIKDLNLAVELLGGYTAIATWGSRNGNTGFINGTRIWKGKGTSYNTYKIDHLLREGWNTINMNVGGITFKGPFLK